MENLLDQQSVNESSNAGQSHNSSPGPVADVGDIGTGCNCPSGLTR